MSASKFTPEVRGGLIERTAAGVSLRDASRAVGVREATVKSWITRGRGEDEGDYAEFVAAVDTVRTEARDRPGPLTREERGFREARPAGFEPATSASGGQRSIH